MAVISIQLLHSLVIFSWMLSSRTATSSWARTANHQQCTSRITLAPVIWTLIAPSSALPWELSESSSSEWSRAPCPQISFLSFSSPCQQWNISTVAASHQQQQTPPFPRPVTWPCEELVLCDLIKDRNGNDRLLRTFYMSWRGWIKHPKTGNDRLLKTIYMEEVNQASRDWQWQITQDQDHLHGGGESCIPRLQSLENCSESPKLHETSVKWTLGGNNITAATLLFTTLSWR